MDEFPHGWTVKRSNSVAVQSSAFPPCLEKTEQLPAQSVVTQIQIKDLTPAMVCRNCKQQNLPDSERGRERCETSAGKPLPHSEKRKKIFKTDLRTVQPRQQSQSHVCQQECPVAVQKTAKLQLNCHAGSRGLVCRYKANE